MWEKVESLMTNAVTKILGIEVAIPNALGPNICCARVEAILDRSNLNVFCEVEKSMK